LFEPSDRRIGYSKEIIEDYPIFFAELFFVISLELCLWAGQEICAWIINQIKLQVLVNAVALVIE
jgi:hypothetical protein